MRAAANHKEVDDGALTVSLKIDDEANEDVSSAPTSPSS